MRKSEPTYNLINDTLKSMLENTRDFMFIKDKDLVYVGCSRAFAVDCARCSSIEDVIGKTDYEIFADRAYAEKNRKEDEKLLLSKESMIEYRETYQGKYGEDRYCLTTKYLIRDEEGRLAGIFGQCRDITAQKETELRLEKSRASLNAALSASNQLSYEYDPKTHTGVCYTDENFFGLPKHISNYPDSLRNSDLFHPEDVEKFIQTAHQMDTGVKKAQCDVRIRKKGEYRWYSCMFDAYFDLEKGRETAILTVVDISDRMTTIQDYNERVKHLGLTNRESLSAGYINLDHDTYDCICIEDGVAPYLKEGIGFEQLMMDTANAVVGEETRKKYRELFTLKNMRKMAEQGHMRVQMEYLFRYNEKHTHWLEAVVDMVKNPITGEIGGVVYSRSIQNERLSSLILQKTMDSFYSKVAVIIEETDEYFMFDSTNGFYNESKCDFWGNLYQELYTYTDSITEKQIKEELNKDIVLKKLEENAEFSFVFLSNRKDDVRRIELKFVYMEDTQGLILGYIRDITDHTLMEKLRYDSEHDSLTGLYNRKKFLKECEYLLNEYPAEQFVMLHMDMKNFHRYNTFFGAEAGDQLLCVAADIVRKKCKDYTQGVYGRIEADVFCALLPYNKDIYEKHLQDASEILANYRSDYLIEIKCGLYFITDKEMPIEPMIARAAIAAKRVDPNSYLSTVIYNDMMEEKLKDEQMIVNEMQNALEQKQFQVYLQPKYALRSSQPVGAEALVRWVHPTKGIISPGKFIPLFEKNGFITNLDRYMWEQVCILLRKWMDEGKTVMPVSVNVSRISIFGPNTVTFLKELVEKYKIEPKYLELELTESAYIKNPDEIKPRLLELQKYGFKILMDDFGSGYSSLNTLKDLPVDVLKLDMRFLSSSKEKETVRGELVISSIVRMSKLLGLPVIVEGVEEQNQTEYLCSIGCEYVQGFLFARPMPVSDYEEKIIPRLKNWPESKKGKQTRVRRILTETLGTKTLMDELFTQPMAVVEYSSSSKRFTCLRVNPAFLEEFDLTEDIRSVQEIFRNHMSDPEYQHFLSAYKRCAETKRSICFEMRWRKEEKEQAYFCKVSYEGQMENESLLIVEFVLEESVEFLCFEGREES